MIDDSTIRNVVSLDDGLDDDRALGDLLASESDSPYEDLEKAREHAAMRECLDDLTPRERMVVDLYYFRDMNFKEIGDALGVTESRISQIHTHMKKKLRDRMARMDFAA
jgi:RNA polymerase sigma factor for flagellar operon FliA